MEPTGLTDGSDVGCERKRAQKEPGISGLTSYRDGAALNGEGKFAAGAGLRGAVGNSVLDSEVSLLLDIAVVILTRQPNGLVWGRVQLGTRRINL